MEGKTSFLPIDLHGGNPQIEEKGAADLYVVAGKQCGQIAEIPGNQGHPIPVGGQVQTGFVQGGRVLIDPHQPTAGAIRQDGPGMAGSPQGPIHHTDLLLPRAQGLKHLLKHDGDVEHHRPSTSSAMDGNASRISPR